MRQQWGKVRTGGLRLPVKLYNELLVAAAASFFVIPGITSILTVLRCWRGLLVGIIF